MASERPTPRELFDRLVDLGPAERERYLDDQGIEGALRDELVDLLDHSDRPHALDALRLSRVLEEVVPEDEHNDVIPNTIGRFRVRGRLGAGGHGVVYKATDPDTGRDVALKVIRPRGGHARHWAELVEYEGRMIVRLEHPNIATLHDIIRIDDDQPCLVMELIEGPTLGAYCEDRVLSLDARLDLFTVVCRAVQHAHNRGIVHCDLKPSNILVSLVDSTPTPRVIDFGIARRVEDGDDAFATAGTRDYMSPEQVAGERETMGPPTDVYALGLILYELLTGRRANDLEELPSEEARRAILEDAPVPPSRLVARSTTFRIKREFDWIIARALEKVPERRYASAGRLADEIVRVRTRRPVVVAPRSVTYHAGRWLARHWLRLSLAAVIVLAGGTALTLNVLRQVERSRTLAVGRETIDVISKAMEMLRMIGDDAALVNMVLANRSRLTSVPTLRADLLHQMGVLLRERSEVQLAAECLFEALELRRDTAGPDNVATALTEHQLALALWWLDRNKEAEDHLRRALPILEVSLGLDANETLVLQNDIALFLIHQERTDEAEPFLQHALEGRRSSLGPDDPVTSEVLANFAQLLARRGAYETALEAYVEAVTVFEAALGPDHASTLVAKAGIARILDRLGQPETALAIVDEAITHWTQMVPPSHFERLAAMRIRTDILISLGRAGQAEGEILERLDLLTQAYGADSRWALDARRHLALAMQKAGRMTDAIDVYRAVFERQEQVLGPEDRDTMITANDLGTVLYELGRTDEARVLLSRSFDYTLATRGREHAETAKVAMNLANCLGPDELARADELYRLAIDGFKISYYPTHALVADAEYSLGALLYQCDQPEEAEPLLRRALASVERNAAPDHVDAIGTRDVLARVLADQRRDVEAEIEFQALIRVAERGLTGDPFMVRFRTGWVRKSYGAFLLERDRPNEALLLLEEAERSLLAIDGFDDSTSYVQEVLELLARCHTKAGRAAAADRYLVRLEVDRSR